MAGRLIIYEPGLPTAGMTWGHEGGIVLGPTAFYSTRELARTVLGELFQLEAGHTGAAAAGGAANEAEAARFAEWAAKLGRFLGLW